MIPLSCLSLEKLIQLNYKNKTYYNKKLIHIVSDPELLILSYELLKSSPKYNFQTLNKIDKD